MLIRGRCHGSRILGQRFRPVTHRHESWIRPNESPRLRPLPRIQDSCPRPVPLGAVDTDPGFAPALGSTRGRHGGSRIPSRGWPRPNRHGESWNRRNRSGPSICWRESRIPANKSTGAASPQRILDSRQQIDRGCIAATNPGFPPTDRRRGLYRNGSRIRADGSRRARSCARILDPLKEIEAPGAITAVPGFVRTNPGITFVAVNPRSVPTDGRRVDHHEESRIRPDEWRRWIRGRESWVCADGYRRRRASRRFQDSRSRMAPVDPGRRILEPPQRIRAGESLQRFQDSPPRTRDSAATSANPGTMPTDASWRNASTDARLPSADGPSRTAAENPGSVLMEL